MTDDSKKSKVANVSGDAEKKPSGISKLIARGTAIYEYCWTGVWRDPRQTVGVRIIKTVNLAVRSFIVPALALLFAISRGFGFQNLVQKELYVYFPAQQKALSTALKFVDSYLKESSQGVFVGIGIIMLLWTLISLLSNIENAFNSIWGITKDRSFPQ